MFVRYLNLFNKHMSGMTYGLGGIVIGTIIDNYRRDLQEDVMYYHPFNWYSVMGGLLGYCLGWRIMPIIKYP